MDPFAEPEMSLADRIRQNVRETVGVGDAALTMGKNMAVQPVAAWRAMADLLRGRGVKNAVRNAESFQERVAGGPKTIEGGRYLEKTGELIKGATQPLTDITDWIGERSPVVGGLAMAGMAAVDPLKIKALAKGLRGAKQLTIPGIKPRSAPELALQELSDAERGLTAKTDLVYDQYSRPNIGNPRRAGPHTIVHPDVPTDEGHQMLEGARERLQGARTRYSGAVARAEAEPQWQLMDELRAGRSPQESLADTLRRETELLNLKTTTPIDAPGGLIQERSGGILDIPEAGRSGTDRTRISPEADQALQQRMDQRRDSRQLVRQLRQAQAHMDNVPEPEIPAWVRNSTELPTSLNPQPAPAGAEWWNKALNVDPNAAPESVAAFLRAAKEQPEIFQFGGMPQNARSLEDFAKEFGDRAGKRIHIEREYGNDEPEYIDVEKTHGRYEHMRDSDGNIIEDDLEHSPGDYPMYDEYGDVKKIKKGLDEKGNPIKVKRRAEGGEPLRDRYGDIEREPRESEGGEYVRDENGNIKWTKEPNDDYSGNDTDKITMRVPGQGYIEVTDWDGSEPMTHATQAGKAGALLYQTLLAHASKEGITMGVDSLTSDNQLRLLSNTLANAARTGENPRDVTGTLSGRRPRATGYAPGDRIWQALAGETDARLANHPEGDPNAIGFTPESFTHRGQPIEAQDIHDRIEEFSPGFRGPQGTKVGPKTLMQNAVFKWLENASPEQAEQVAREWPKRFGKPLFSAAGAGVGTATLADLLRQDQEAQD